MKVVERQLKELKMYENNPRNNDEAVDEVAKSIEEFGFKVPMVIDKDNIIVCGHTRYKACLKLGIQSVPCVVADDLTDEQIKAFRLVENKTAECATWDYFKLDEELEKIETMLDIFKNENDSWFKERERWDNSKQEGNEEYNEFLEKFKPKITTDDCYTPENVYEVIAGYVEEEYGLKRRDFVRPFYPGGDYQAFKYKPTDVVVDNPPFSITKEIIEFYTENKIKYFLFINGLTTLSGNYTFDATCIIANAKIIYENGAIICTNFITNLERPELLLKTCGKLNKRIKEANKENKQTKELPKYKYPSEVLYVPFLNKLTVYDIDFEVLKDEAYKISKLDAQEGRVIFGGGFLLSEEKTKEKELKEKELKEKELKEKELKETFVFELSEREREIVKSLGAKK